MEPGDLQACGFFLLRTPLLPLSMFLKWGEDLECTDPDESPEVLEAAWQRDCDSLGRRLRAIVSRREVREALFVASPDLEEHFDRLVHATRDALLSAHSYAISRGRLPSRPRSGCLPAARWVPSQRARG